MRGERPQLLGSGTRNSRTGAKCSLYLNSATHSLIYIYTAMSADLGLPGVHKFTAIGLLDGKPFDRFDTDNPRKTPTTNWARRHLTTDYLDKGTQSRLSKQKWFGVNLDIVMTLMGHSASDGDVHVIQWLHGCYGETNPSEERLRFVHGVDKYAYDGDDLMSFDYLTLRWSAATEAANPIADKWNGVTVLTEYTVGYLCGECIKWLTTFVGYSKRELRDRVTVPDVYMFTRKTNGTTLTLICVASGFPTNTPAMRLMKNDTGYRVVKHWRAGDRTTIPTIGWPNAVLLSTVVGLCIVALCLVVFIVRKRRTGQFTFCSIAHSTHSRLSQL
uniref:MHC class I-like antigen recognition-like domain-containing protein n=1 Tax=Oreochromis niloticus TaxID=8128 RepID=A0A669DXX2_ORENI